MSPKRLLYIASVVGRELPQPVAEAQDSEQLDDASDEDDDGRFEGATGSRAGADLRARSALHCFADERHRA